MKWSERGFCSACMNCSFEHYDCEYSMSGYYICEREHSASGLKPFPLMKTPKNCNDFVPLWNERLDSDYWGLLADFDFNIKLKDKKLQDEIISSIIKFEKAMGTYSYGNLGRF